VAARHETNYRIARVRRRFTTRRISRSHSCACCSRPCRRALQKSQVARLARRALTTCAVLGARNRRAASRSRPLPRPQGFPGARVSSRGASVFGHPQVGTESHEGGPLPAWSRFRGVLHEPKGAPSNVVCPDWIPPASVSTSTPASPAACSGSPAAAARAPAPPEPWCASPPARSCRSTSWRSRARPASASSASRCRAAAHCYVPLLTGGRLDPRLHDRLRDRLDRPLRDAGQARRLQRLTPKA
jgi:hypothetical protein